MAIFTLAAGNDEVSSTHVIDIRLADRCGACAGQVLSIDPVGGLQLAKTPWNTRNHTAPSDFDLTASYSILYPLLALHMRCYGKLMLIRLTALHRLRDGILVR